MLKFENLKFLCFMKNIKNLKKFFKTEKICKLWTVGIIHSVLFCFQDDLQGVTSSVGEVHGGVHGGGAYSK